MQIPAPAGAVIGTICLSLAPVEAARLGPPSATLAQPDVKVLVVTVADKHSPNRALFRVSKILKGEAEPEVLLRMDPASLAQLEPGRPYLIGYSELRTNPLFRKGAEKDPEGPHLVELAGVGDAWFEDSPAMRTVALGAEASGRPVLEALLDVLEAEDSRQQRFAVFELYGRTELLRTISKSDLKRVLGVLERSGLDPLSRNFLLQAMRFSPVELGRGWLAAQCRQVLDGAALELNPLSNVPDLVRNSALLLGEVGTAGDVGRLARHLQSNDSGVGKAALTAMDRLDREEARRLASTMLESGQLKDEVRMQLRRYLEQ